MYNIIFHFMERINKTFRSNSVFGFLLPLFSLEQHTILILHGLQQLLL